MLWGLFVTACRKVSSKPISGSVGMAIAANKVHGIRAANVVLPEFAALAREHNDANIITVSARFVEHEVNCAIVKAFLETEFGGGRHAGRVAKIAALEQ